ncbi:MAG: polyprenyl synthetase family protein [Eubacteriales bacterium]
MIEKIENKLTANRILLENELAKYYLTDSEEKLLTEAQKYGLLDGGKRIRPFLLLELCRIFGTEVKIVIPYACAIEMVHASSLIHDDMPCMDNDGMRRGKPSTHKAFGESLALLAGDAMMAKAFETAVTNPYLPAGKNAAAVKILANAAGECGMLAGQTMDTCYEDRKLTFEELLKLHRLKTGKLICACARLACLASDIKESDERYSSVMKYSENIGLAFQIIDDILDYEEGKAEQNSFLSFMTAKEARAYADKLTKEAVEAVRALDDGTLSDLAEYLTVRKY